jgi:hypothetical protein
MLRKFAVLAAAAVMTLAGLATYTPPAKAQGGGAIVLTGDITSNMKLKKKKRYLLQGGVFVRSGATLKIPAGTQIFGDTGSFLVIDKGAKIIAKGKANKPIVFTSAQPAGQRRRGDWGGLIFNGNAPINVPGGVAQGEGDTGEYGGTDPADNQGIMQYVRVEYGGFPISPDNELNCIAFQGVGSGTQVDFVEALNGGDDAFEFFGGTANGKHFVLVGETDDGFDWTFGYSGKVQFVVVQQRADGAGIADRGVEADNNETDFNLSPRSDPTLANFTLIGDLDPTFPGSSQGMELRRGTAGHLRNFIVTGFKNVGFRITDQATYDQFSAGNLDLQGFILFNNNGGDNLTGTTMDAVAAKGFATLKILDQTDPQLTAPFSKTAPNFLPQAGSPALDPANVAPKFNDPFFEDANYVGAFDGTHDWTAGWTIFESPAQ